MGSEPLDVALPNGSTHAVLFGALCDAMGRQPEGGEGAAWGKIAKVMAEAAVDPAHVLIRAAHYRKQWPNVELTPTALWRNWGRFASGGPASIVPLVECALCGGHAKHRAWCEVTA